MHILFHSEPKITLFYLLSFVFVRCTTRCHSLFVVTRCPTRCHSLYHSLSFAVTCYTTRCNSMYHSSVFYKRSSEHSDFSKNWYTLEKTFKTFPIKEFLIVLSKPYFSKQSSLRIPTLTLNCIKENLVFVTWDHSFSTYAKPCEKLTFLTPWYTHVPVRIRG